MFRSTSAGLTGLALLFIANITAAVGLGEIKLFSTLNEPFHAEIRLHDVGNLNVDEIIIAFATPEEFSNKKVERHYFYNEFVFDVMLDDSEYPKVKITSHSVVREPFLEFIIESRWPSGRVQREYTVLLDKPAALDSH